MAFCMTRALRIENRPDAYISEPESWGALPWDLLSLAEYYLGLREEAVKAVQRAVELAPDNPRLRENLRLMQSAG